MTREQAIKAGRKVAARLASERAQAVPAFVRSLVRAERERFQAAERRGWEEWRGERQ